MILLLAQNSLQVRTLVMTLKLGGHNIRVVNDEHEAINMIKNVPREVHGLVMGGAGCQRTLAEKITVLSSNQIYTPIYLVGLPASDKDFVKFKERIDPLLNLTFCNNDGLLQNLKR